MCVYKTFNSAGCEGGKATYTGHKQSGLHGIKSFGPFWGESQAYNGNPCHTTSFPSSQPARGGVVRSNNDASSGAYLADNGTSAVVGSQNNNISSGVNPKAAGKPAAAILARDGVNPAAKHDAIAVGRRSSRIGQREEGGEGHLGELDDVVPSMSGVSRSKRGVELVPVRGISRVLSGS